MSEWYEVFDNEEVQLVTRKQAFQFTVWVTLAIVLSAGWLALAHNALIPLPVALFMVFSTSFCTLYLLDNRLVRLRRVMWCVKLSAHSVSGYAYTRKKTEFDWMEVRRIELAAKGMRILGSESAIIEIPHLFPDYAALSHRVFYYAEIYDIPVCIHGQPWQELDVCRLFPFLKDDASKDNPPAKV